MFELFQTYKKKELNSNCYIVYNKKDCQICLKNKYTDIEGICRQLSEQFPSTMVLWVSIPLSTEEFALSIKNCVKCGFARPYITDEMPFIKPKSICMALSKINKGQSSHKHSHINRTILNSMYVLQQYKNNSDNCNIHAKFSDKAIKFLKGTSHRGHTKNKDRTVTQKELGGELYVSKIVKPNNDYIFIIDVNEKNVKPGAEEEVSVSATKYNFHSHPKEAYEKHRVEKAWPSLSDFMGYLQLGNRTIFHCVATLEGIYVMSFGDYWVNRLKDVKKDFVKKNYRIERDIDKTPFEYVKQVNNLKYKNYPIFVVKFLPWGTATKTIFSINYKKNGLSCEAISE